MLLNRGAKIMVNCDMKLLYLVGLALGHANASVTKR